VTVADASNRGRNIVWYTGVHAECKVETGALVSKRASSSGEAASASASTQTDEEDGEQGESWRHVALSVRQSQRLVELLIDGELASQCTMSAEGKLFTSGSGLALRLAAGCTAYTTGTTSTGSPADDQADGAALSMGCVALLQCYPTSALTHGAVMEIYMTQRELLQLPANHQPYASAPPVLSQLRALPEEAALGERVQALLQCVDAGSGGDSTEQLRVGWPESAPSVGCLCPQGSAGDCVSPLSLV
jgi:hypothetical protein